MILLNDFQKESESLIQEEIRAVERVLRSGWYILGHEVEKFEAKWAEFCGVRFAVGVGNGMDALEVGLRSLEIGPGDEVITTPMTAFATVLSILRVGATPILADIEPETALLDYSSIKRCFSKRTKAIMLVHLYGHIKNMDEWISLAKDAKIHLLEDCAQSHLARWKGKIAGSFGKWGAYSFYPTKNLGAVGDAGCLVTNDANIDERVKVLRNYGQSQRYHHPHIGMNSRLDEIQAALLQVRLAWLERFTQRRRELAKAYYTGIHNTKIRLMEAPKDEENHAYHLFVIRCKDRNALQEYLLQHQIKSLIHYPIPIHHQEPCLELSRDPKGLPATELHASECLSIPCHPQMTDEEVEKVICCLNCF